MSMFIITLLFWQLQNVIISAIISAITTTNFIIGETRCQLSDNHTGDITAIIYNLDVTDINCQISRGNMRVDGRIVGDCDPSNQTIVPGLDSSPVSTNCTYASSITSDIRAEYLINCEYDGIWVSNYCNSRSKLN